MSPANKLVCFLITSVFSLLILAPPSFAQECVVNGPTSPCAGREICDNNPALCCRQQSQCTGPEAASLQPVSGGGVWYDQTPDEFRKRVFNTDPNEIFGERYTYAQVNWIINSFVAMFSTRTQSAEELQELINDLLSNGPSSNLRDYARLGLPGLLIGGISQSLASPPASGIYEIKTLASRVFDISTGVQPAYAQGYGFDQLSIVQTLWSATRNMAYLISVVLLIAAGFAIMFRVKINPQTVVSLQTMIPKLVITLVLITFSLAIAGLVIDLIYVLIALFIGGLQVFNVIQPDNLGNAISWFTSSGYSGVVAYYLIPWVLLLILGIATLFAVGSGTVMAVVGLIFTVFFVWTLFKIWWMLVKTQLTLIFLIVIAPFQIMMDLIPGQSGFSSWFRNVIANASVFVVVPIMFVLNMIFWRPMLGSTEWIPGWASLLEAVGLNPLGQVTTGVGGATALPNLPFVNGSDFALNFILGYAILSLIPKVADMIRDALKVPAFKYGTAFQEALAPVGMLAQSRISQQQDRLKFEMDQASKAGGAAGEAAYRKAAGTSGAFQLGSNAVKRISGS